MQVLCMASDVGFGIGDVRSVLGDVPDEGLSP